MNAVAVPTRSHGPSKVPLPMGGRVKARHAAECRVLEQIPNIGTAMADDLRRIGIGEPRDLLGHDALDLYRRVCEDRGTRMDPCVLDTLMAATDFMHGAGPAPWWQYTVARKARYGQVLDAGGARLGRRGPASRGAPAAR